MNRFNVCVSEEWNFMNMHCIAGSYINRTLSIKYISHSIVLQYPLGCTCSYGCPRPSPGMNIILCKLSVESIGLIIVGDP
jgi:hypothetical protein